MYTQDITLPIDSGLINIRVGAIIIKNNQLLMVGNKKVDYLYSVGGRIKFGEKAEEAVIREVYEETGYKVKVNRLGFIHENFFNGELGDSKGKLFYEISFFFYIDVEDDFNPVCFSETKENIKEYLKWVSLDTNEKMFPAFFKTELKNPVQNTKHIVTDDRKK